jgi:hypothetical protein
VVVGSQSKVGRSGGERERAKRGGGARKDGHSDGLKGAYIDIVGTQGKRRCYLEGVERARVNEHKCQREKQ